MEAAIENTAGTTETLRLKIRREEHTENPRTAFGENASTMACWHHGVAATLAYGFGDVIGLGRPLYSGYVLGDQQPRCDPDTWIEDLPEGTVILPLYLYDHGGLSISTGDFGDCWDSGQVGWVYMEPDKIRSEFVLESGATISDEIRDKVLALLKAEVAVYDQYLRGDVWYFVLERGTTCGDCLHTTWEFEESCGGIYGGDDMIEHLRDYLPVDAHHLIEAAWRDRQ